MENRCYKELSIFLFNDMDSSKLTRRWHFSGNWWKTVKALNVGMRD